MTDRISEKIRRSSFFHAGIITAFTCLFLMLVFGERLPEQTEKKNAGKAVIMLSDKFLGSKKSESIAAWIKYGDPSIFSKADSRVSISSFLKNQRNWNLSDSFRLPLEETISFSGFSIDTDCILKKNQQFVFVPSSYTPPCCLSTVKSPSPELLAELKALGVRNPDEDIKYHLVFPSSPGLFPSVYVIGKPGDIQHENRLANELRMKDWPESFYGKEKFISINREGVLAE